MPSFQSNVSLGREVELYNRVNDSDPTNAAFIMLAIAYTGMESDSTLRDYDTVAAILAASNNEVTNGGYGRKTITDADIAAYTVDDTNNLILLTLPAQTYATILTGDTWGKIIVAYDPDTTGGTDTTLVPVSFHEAQYAGSYIVPNGTNIVVDLSAGWIQAK